MYIWWRIQQDTERRLWAERMIDGDPAHAKRQHANDKQFAWADGYNPTVTPLEFVDEQGRTQYVASGYARESDTDRTFRTGTTPTISVAEPEPPADDLPF